MTTHSPSARLAESVMIELEDIMHSLSKANITPNVELAVLALKGCINEAARNNINKTSYLQVPGNANSGGIVGNPHVRF